MIGNQLKLLSGLRFCRLEKIHACMWHFLHQKFVWLFQWSLIFDVTPCSPPPLEKEDNNNTCNGVKEGDVVVTYTCQLFLKYRREIFILGVLGFLKNDTITSEYSWRTPKSSEEVRSLQKTSICDESRNRPCISQSQSWNACKCELAPSAFHLKNKSSWGRYCHLFILHMASVPYMRLS